MKTPSGQTMGRNVKRREIMSRFKTDNIIVTRKSQTDKQQDNTFSSKITLGQLWRDQLFLLHVLVKYLNECIYYLYICYFLTDF